MRYAHSRVICYCPCLHIISAGTKFSDWLGPHWQSGNALSQMVSFHKWKKYIQCIEDCNWWGAAVNATEKVVFQKEMVLRIWLDQIGQLLWEGGLLSQVGLSVQVWLYFWTLQSRLFDSFLDSSDRVGTADMSGLLSFKSWRKQFVLYLELVCDGVCSNLINWN